MCRDPAHAVTATTTTTSPLPGRPESHGGREPLFTLPENTREPKACVRRLFQQQQPQRCPEKDPTARCYIQALERALHAAPEGDKEANRLAGLVYEWLWYSAAVPLDMVLSLESVFSFSTREIHRERCPPSYSQALHLRRAGRGARSRRVRLRDRVRRRCLPRAQTGLLAESCGLLNGSCQYTSLYK